MQFIIYVLNDNDGKLYKGLTNNLARRLAEHRRGKTITTRRMENIEIVYTEKYSNFGEARKRELYLKSAAGRKFLKQQLEK